MIPNRSNVNEWLGKIGKQQGLNLSLDANGHVCLACAEGLKVLIEAPDNSDLFFFYSPLLQLPEDIDAQNAAMKKALSLNNFSLETGGANVGYDARTSSILLTFAEKSTSVDGDTFAECLGRFIEAASAMKVRMTTETMP